MLQKKKLATVAVWVLLVACACSPARFEGISALSVERGWSLRELAWSPDGDYIAATVTDRRHPGVYVIDLEDGSYHPVKDYEDRTLYEAAGPEWSPDGGFLILYYPPGAYAPGKNPHVPPLSIVIVDAATGELQREVWGGTYATWGPGPDNVIVLDSDIGKGEQEVPIYRIDLETGERHEIGVADAGLVMVRGALDVSSTGKLVYLADWNELQIVDTETGMLIGKLRSEVRLYSPAWSPDGQILAFIQDVPARGDDKGWRHVIYLATADGTCRGDPLDVGVVIRSIDWSPDGGRLVFSTPDARGKLFFVDLNVGVGKELLDSYRRCLR